MNATIEKFGYPATLIREWQHWVLLLRPAQPSADRSGKPLACPVCRVVTNVARGQASSLPKNFSLLR